MKKTGNFTYEVTFKTADVNFGIFQDMGFSMRDADPDITQLSASSYLFTGSEIMMDEVRKLDFRAIRKRDDQSLKVKWRLMFFLMTPTEPGMSITSGLLLFLKRLDGQT